MTEVNQELTRKVADLARLELTEEEVATFTPQLEQILGYIDQLNLAEVKVNGEEISPMTHPLELDSPLREDVPRPSPKDEAGKPKTLKPAPDVLYDGYKVPPIL